jgi:hypothetical protein
MRAPTKGALRFSPLKLKMANRGLAFFSPVIKMHEPIVCLAIMSMTSILCLTMIALFTQCPPIYVVATIASITSAAIKAINKLVVHGAPRNPAFIKIFNMLLFSATLKIWLAWAGLHSFLFTSKH